MDVEGGWRGGNLWWSQAWDGGQRNDCSLVRNTAKMMKGITGLIARHSEPAKQTLWSPRRLFGDDSDLHFWTVASHYLQTFAQARQLSVASADGQVQSEAAQPSPQNHLDICHDVLCESSYFQVSYTPFFLDSRKKKCSFNWDAFKKSPRQTASCCSFTIISAALAIDDLHGLERVTMQPEI